MLSNALQVTVKILGNERSCSLQKSNLIVTFTVTFYVTFSPHIRRNFRLIPSPARDEKIF